MRNHFLRAATAKGPATDPFFSNVSLLLHGNGANGSTAIIDSSPSPKAVTAVDNAKISTAIADPFGNSTRGVLAFDGTGDYLTAANNASLNFDSGDFTIECWFYAAALPILNIDNYRIATLVVFGANTQGYEFAVNFTSNLLTLSRNGQGHLYAAVASFTFALSTWYHVAYTRSGTANRLFVNGQSLTLTMNSFSPSASPGGIFRIGAYRLFYGYDQDFNGYIDDLRITKGIARYTGNFAPPTAQFPDA